MMNDRREFSIADQVAIVRRATDSSGRVHCERCGAWLKSRREYEIDHILAEGMRPDADRRRKLTPADGQLLCVALCHKSKTKVDKADIGEAKRREAAELGLRRPGKAKFPNRRKEKPEGRLPQRSAGLPGLMRRGFVPAGRT